MDPLTLPPEIDTFDGLMQHLIDCLSEDDVARAQALFLEYEAQVIELTRLRSRREVYLHLQFPECN